MPHVSDSLRAYSSQEFHQEMECSTQVAFEAFFDDRLVRKCKQLCGRMEIFYRAMLSCSRKANLN